MKDLFGGKSIFVKAPGGEIIAETFPKNDYPCIDIRINGDIAAVVEWDNNEERFRIHSWDNVDDDPASSITFKERPYDEDEEV